MCSQWGSFSVSLVILENASFSFGSPDPDPASSWASGKYPSRLSPRQVLCKGRKALEVYFLSFHISEALRSANPLSKALHIMSNCLLITGLHVHESASKATIPTSRHVGLANGTEHCAAGKVSIQSEESFDKHVQIFSNGLGVTVPTTDTINKL